MEFPSAAAQVIITVIPIVGIVAGTTIVFFYLYWNHKQKMFLIEKGMYRPKPLDLIAFSFFAGCILTGVGAGLTFFFYLKEGLGYSTLGGLIPLSVGISLLFFFSIQKKLQNGDGHETNR